MFKSVNHGKLSANLPFLRKWNQMVRDVESRLKVILD